jgi:hypothetical protein
LLNRYGELNAIVPVADEPGRRFLDAERDLAEAGPI